MFKQLLENRIFKNFSVLTGTNIVIQFISILSSIRLARLLQPEGYGYFNLILTLSGIFLIISSYGLKQVVIRYVARNKSYSKYVFHISNHIRLVTSIIAILCLAGYNYFLNETTLPAFVVILVSLHIIFSSLWESVECIAFGNEQMAPSGYINLAFTGLWVITVYLIPRDSFNVEFLLITYVAIQFLKSLSYYFWLRGEIFTKSKLTEVNSDIGQRYFIKQSNYYFILAIFTAIQIQVPIVLLNHNSTLEQVGVFNLGNRILGPLQMVILTALTALYPSFSRLALTDITLFAKRVKVLLNILVIIGIWGCLCFTLFSKEVVLLLYGKEYLGSVKVILIQCWFTLLYGIFCTIGTVLNSFDKQRLLAILSIIYGTLCVPVFFIGSKYGAIGLAWAFVIAAYINMTYHWVIFGKLLSPDITSIYTLKLFSILILASLFSLFVPFEFNIFIKLLIGIAITSVTGLYLNYRELPKLLSK
jgi:O-antigen/teichoic acid export membrane protein